VIVCDSAPNAPGRRLKSTELLEIEILISPSAKALPPARLVSTIEKKATNNNNLTLHSRMFLL
jgi:hypothetical protein